MCLIRDLIPGSLAVELILLKEKDLKYSKGKVKTGYLVNFFL